MADSLLLNFDDNTAPAPPPQPTTPAADQLLFDPIQSSAPAAATTAATAAPPAEQLLFDPVSPSTPAAPVAPVAAAAATTPTATPVDQPLFEAAPPTATTAAPVAPLASPTEAVPATSTSTPQESNTGSESTAPAPASPAATQENGTTASPAQDGVASAEQDAAPQDPRLKEILEKFGGRWKMVRSDPYDEYLKALGVGFLNRKLAGKTTPEMDFQVRGEKIYVSMRSTLHSQSYVFQLDEEVENLVEKMRQGVVCTYTDGKLVQQMTPLDAGWTKVQEVERSINENGEHVVIFTAGSAVCRRYFTKLPELGITPPPVSQPESS
ncbi:clathrin coat assembly protein AP180 [Aplysia californica]|uniref:Clathrin coat assembly protein AP180 n=1 Tax=Aplysia californica TaxID=6500 RepID=A0ABM0ZVM0_APLCA|nr:clathrin coat assembly protein AP180 [Aplysia californica]